MKIRRISALSLLSISALLAACNSEPSKQKVFFKIKAVDSNNAPISDVQFFLNQDEFMFGKTDSSGVFEDLYEAKVGDQVVFRLVPPEGYQALRATENSFQVAESSAPLEVEFEGLFTPPKRDFLFVVEGAKGDGVYIDGELAYTLDDSKRGLFLYPGSPGKEFSLQVGASAYSWRFSTADELYLVTSKTQHALVSNELAAPALAMAEPPAEPSTQAPTFAPPPEPIRPEPIRPEPIRTPRTEKRARAERAERVERVEPAREERGAASRQTSALVKLPDPDEDDGFNEPPSREERTPPARVSSGSASSGRSAPSAADLLGTLQPGRASGGASPSPRSSSRPEPRPEPIARVEPTPPPPPPPPPPVAAPSRPTSPPPRVTPSSVGDSVSGMSKEAIDARVDQIESSFDQTNRLSAQDINFLRQLNANNGNSYYSAHRVLGSYYFSIQDFRRQRDSLEIATSKGRYKSDSKVLLALSQAYGHHKQYAKAISTLKRAEAKMGRLSGADKANVYRSYAEYLRLSYIAQRSQDPTRADVSLLDTAIQKWKRLESISSPSSKDAADARSSIQRLEQMKSEAM